MTLIDFGLLLPIIPDDAFTALQEEGNVFVVNDLFDTNALEQAVADTRAGSIALLASGRVSLSEVFVLKGCEADEVDFEVCLENRCIVEAVLQALLDGGCVQATRAVKGLQLSCLRLYGNALPLISSVFPSVQRLVLCGEKESLFDELGSILSLFKECVKAFGGVQQLQVFWTGQEFAAEDEVQLLQCLEDLERDYIRGTLTLTLRIWNKVSGVEYDGSEPFLVDLVQRSNAASGQHPGRVVLRFASPLVL